MVQGRLATRFAAFALVCTAACTSSSAATDVKKPPATPVAAKFPPFTVQVSGDAPADVMDAVHHALDTYLDRATVTALRTGAAGDVASLLTPDLAGNVVADHASLVDDGMPGVVALRQPTATAVVTAAGTDLAAAHVDISVVALVGTVPVTIHRTGDIAFVHDGDQWHIDSYDLHVTRDSLDAPAAAPGTPTTGTARP